MAKQEQRVKATLELHERCSKSDRETMNFLLKEMTNQKGLLSDQEIRIATIIEAEKAMNSKYEAVDASLAETMMIIDETQQKIPRIDVMETVMSLEQRVDALTTDVRTLVTTGRSSAQMPTGDGRNNTTDANIPPPIRHRPWAEQTANQTP